MRDGIRAAQDAGLGPVKINCVLLRGFNDSQIEAFAEFSRNEQVIVRFIECMPLEEDRTWSPATVVPMKEILARLNAVRPSSRCRRTTSPRPHGGSPSTMGWGRLASLRRCLRHFADTAAACGVTSDGKLRTCLFSQSDHDLVGHMLRGATDARWRAGFGEIVQHKEARHHIGEPGFLKPSRSMVHIGG